MKRIIFLLFCTLSLSAMFLVGCSDDNDNGTNSEKIVGDTNSFLFGKVFDGADEVDEWTGDMFNFIGNMFDTIFDHPDNPITVAGNTNKGRAMFAAADSVMLTYHSNTGYWYFYFIGTDTIMGEPIIIESMEIIDSVQFRHGTSVVQWPDSALLTGITNGIQVTLSSTENNGSIVATQLLDVTSDDFFGVGDLLVNGSQSLDMGFSDSSFSENCSFDINMGSALNNIAINPENDECPSSGSIVHNGSMNISCTGDTTFTFSDSWVISTTFNGTLATIVFENSTTRWEVTDSCSSGGSQAISPLGRMSDRF